MGKIGPDGVFNFGFNKDGSKYVGPGCGPCKSKGGVPTPTPTPGSKGGVVNMGQYSGEAGFKAFKEKQRALPLFTRHADGTPAPTPGS